MRALGPLKPLTGNQGGVTEADSKQMYGEDDIAALMGFSHVQKGSNLQDIWTSFQSTLGKNLDMCRQQIMAHMNRWSHDHQIPIHMSVYLEGTTIKVIMELKFNPGEGVVHMSACTSAKTEQI